MSGAGFPNFAELLTPVITEVPDPARPLLLAGLERGAAARYRSWATDRANDRAIESEEVSKGLLACAAREEEIAACVERLFPLVAEHREALDKALPAAREIYHTVFTNLSVADQFRTQANAERQGAGAWRLLATQIEDAAVRREIEFCATLEEENARFLERTLEHPDAVLGS